MTSLLAPTMARDPARVREQIATRLAFFIAGFSTAAWAPLVPLAKERLGLDDGSLGLLLLCLGLGSITAMPITGVLTTRIGCKAVITVLSPADAPDAAAAGGARRLACDGDCDRRLRRSPGNPRRCDEPSGDHRGAQQRQGDDVRLPWTVQCRRHRWRQPGQPPAGKRWRSALFWQRA